MALAVIGLYLYIFFTCYLTEFSFLGIQIQRPGDLAIPLLLSIFVLSFRIQPWNWSDRFSKIILFIVFLIFFCILFHPHAGSDAAQYYANLRSLWLDGDLNFYDDALNNIGEDYLGSLHLWGYTYNGFSVDRHFFGPPFFY